MSAMFSTKQVIFFMCTSSVLLAVLASPDSAGEVPLPGPGLVYGGIPYGSMSGNVAEFFSRQTPSVVRGGNYNGNSLDPNYAPIEQYL